ncbi:type II secretion system protein GspM [Parendozoicomonas haliclonae]|uniref:Type II secretion system protein M n=1 Tax=Parendozoicomonas haliclonae TaxID=1960125 RepID=A0A1X7AGZ1_9GAMM|nr:type II secretion system protein M [Parendozoicomonas haliclonae]SMA39976.1 Type II secretion system protein M [Parendozoicomonas haliclonae]
MSSNVASRLQEWRSRGLQYWNTLSEREKHLCVLLGPVITIWIIWMGIIQPIKAQRAQLEEQVGNSQQMLARVETMATQISELKASGQVSGNSVPKGSHQPLNRVVNQSAGQHKLVIKSLRSSGNGVQVTLADAPFTRVMVWLDSLEKEYQVTADRVQLEKAQQSGVVSIKRLELTRL